MIAGYSIRGLSPIAGLDRLQNTRTHPPVFLPMASEKTLYRRTLPGGGYVNVDVESPSSSGVHRAYVAVERRSDPMRRDGHTPPIVAKAEGGTRQSVFAQLLAIATDNVAVARALLRWKSDGKARF